MNAVVGPGVVVQHMQPKVVYQHVLLSHMHLVVVGGPACQVHLTAGVTWHVQGDRELQAGLCVDWVGPGLQMVELVQVQLQTGLQVWCNNYCHRLWQ